MQTERHGAHLLPDFPRLAHTNSAGFQRISGPGQAFVVPQAKEMVHGAVQNRRAWEN